MATPVELLLAAGNALCIFGLNNIFPVLSLPNSPITLLFDHLTFLIIGLSCHLISHRIKSLINPIAIFLFEVLNMTACFLGLPIEIREMIYKDCLCYDGVLTPYPTKFNKDEGIKGFQNGSR